MKYCITLFISLFIVVNFAEAQSWDGNRCYVGKYATSFIFKEVYDANIRGEGIYKRVYFNVQLEKEMHITFSSRGSVVKDTYFQLYKTQPGTTILAQNDGDGDDDQAYLELTLTPGTYYLSVTKYGTHDGSITMNITGKENNPTSIFYAGNYNDEFTYTNTENTFNYSNSYGLETSDVTYRFSMEKTLDINIIAATAIAGNSRIYLLNSLRQLLQTGKVGHLFYERLPPGTYYVIVEGNETDGEIKTTISGYYHCPDSYQDIGTFGDSFFFSEEEWMDNYPDILGNELGDIVYRFTLTKPMIIDVSHQGSKEQCTAIQLWDIELNKLADNLSNPSNFTTINPNQATMRIPLSAGVYYLISESIEAFNSNNDRTITTIIEGLVLNELKADTTQNYIYTRTMTSEDGDTFIDKVQFYDGLGRPIETIRRRANPSGFNLVTYQEYDTYGRESNNWLSRVGTDGSSNFIPFSQFKDLSSDVYDDETAVYSKIVYEESPLNRIVEQYGAGKDWHINHRCVQTDLMTNILGNDTLNCALFKVENEWENDTILTLKREGNYNSCQLFVTRVRDEDKNQTFEFKDKLGRLILRRQFIDHESSDTYYIYNALGLPLIVIPPKASDLLMKDTKNTWISKNDTILQRYVYLYKYIPSREQLCRAMKFPGCAWTFYMYDLNNRCIFIQDANMRMRGEWQFTLPDISGRTCVVGTCCNRMNALQEEQLTSKSLIAVRRDDNAEFGYSFVNHDISLMSPTVISVNYYDDYSFTYLPNFDYADFGFNSDPGFDNIFAENVVGLQTGSLSSIISNGLTVLNYIPMIVYYDCRGRLIQSRYGNHLSNGLEEEYTAYNFVGQPTKRKHVHSATGKATQTEIYSYTYDHAGRLLTTSHQLNDGSPVVLVSNEYDELGRLKSNNRNGNPILKTDYTYNVRSWVKSIAGPLFNESLYYNERRPNGTNVSCYNGNISGIDWNVSGDKARGYNFSYDNLSRLTGASYLEGNTSSDKFSTFYSYDKHGNILNLTRHGNIGTTTYGVIDDLIMSYDGNQLVSVEDKGVNPSLSMSMDFRDGSHGSVEYAYDGNGNMVKDLNKGISMIEYNSLNLPRRVTFTGVNNPVNEYVYSADGKKLSVIHKSSTEKRTDYIGSLIYENGSLKRILVDGGYIENGIYHFYLQDHLGNNRVVAKSDGIVVQTTHYYPYGMSFAEGTFADKQPYKYNGKELDTDNGLNLYDYDARQMDGALGRFIGVDAHTENYYSWSPYVYVGGNPLKYIDPTGKDWFVNGGTGDIHFFRGVTDLRKLSDEQMALAGINKENLSGYERLGGDDMIKIGNNTIALSKSGEMALEFMAYHGFVSADRVRVEATTTEYTYTEADGGLRVVNSTTTTQEVGRYKSYVRTHYVERQDNGNILEMTMNPVPDWNKEVPVGSREPITSPGIQKSVKISDYKVPVGTSYSTSSQRTNVAPETKNNLIRIFLDIFNMIVN